VLLMLVRGTNLSIVPDPAATGAFIGELKNVTVRQALGLVLPPLGLDYSIEGSFVRVFRRETETRLFDLNYSIAERTSTATVGRGATVSSATKSDLFTDVTNGVRLLLSDRATFNVDRKAGLVQVTDYPERLDRVSVYLDAVQDRLHRQAQIDVRLVDVELNDEKQTGIDWALVASQLHGEQPGVPRPAPRPSLTGLRVTDRNRLMDVLAAQGTVSVVANPRVMTMNNEPAIVRTDALTFSVTPQISSDAIVTLSLSPIVQAPQTAEADLLARVADGETLVISGFTRDRESRERKVAGVTGGGWFGRTTVVTRKRIELVVLLTPSIVTPVAGAGR
jgi:type II secretory pathway component GspD/PulD (secretin)